MQGACTLLGVRDPNQSEQEIEQFHSQNLSHVALLCPSTGVRVHTAFNVDGSLGVPRGRYGGAGGLQLSIRLYQVCRVILPQSEGEWIVNERNIGSSTGGG